MEKIFNITKTENKRLREEVKAFKTSLNNLLLEF